VNVIVGPVEGTPTAQELFDAGVKRIGLGSSPYLYAMRSVWQLAQAVGKGDLADAGRGLPFRTALGLLGDPPAAP
jgi:hypothetical protein